MAGATPWIVSFFALNQRLKGPLRLGPANQRLSDGAETAGRDAVAEPREELPRDRLATDPWMLHGSADVISSKRLSLLRSFRHGKRMELSAWDW
jgi:hypothetical protein